MAEIQHSGARGAHSDRRTTAPAYLSAVSDSFLARMLKFLTMDWTENIPLILEDISQPNMTAAAPSDSGGMPIGVLFTPLYILTIFLLIILSMSGLCTCLWSIFMRCRSHRRQRTLIPSSNVNSSSSARKMKVDESQLEVIGEYFFEGTESSDHCTICMNLFKLGDPCRTMPSSCSHTFHKACIDEWFLHSCHCPLCKRSIPDLLVESKNPEQRDGIYHSTIDENLHADAVDLDLNGDDVAEEDIESSIRGTNIVESEDC